MVMNISLPSDNVYVCSMNVTFSVDHLEAPRKKKTTRNKKKSINLYVYDVYQVHGRGTQRGRVEMSFCGGDQSSRSDPPCGCNLSML